MQDVIGNAQHNLGEKIAFELGLSDEMILKDPLAGVKLQALEVFKAPDAPEEWQEVGKDINSALESARNLREEQRNPGKGVPGLPATPNLESAGATFGASVGKAISEESQKREASSGSASSIFKSIRDAALRADDFGAMVNVNEKQLAVLEKIEAKPVFCSRSNFGSVTDGDNISTV